MGCTMLVTHVVGPNTIPAMVLAHEVHGRAAGMA